MRVRSIGLYEPAWGDDRAREQGHDEDVVTLAVAAGREALRAAPGEAGVRRVVVVTSAPDVLEGFASAVVAAGLDIASGTPVELRVGGGPALLDALATAANDTLVIGVDLAIGQGAASGAAAALTGPGGRKLELVGAVDGSLPMRVQHVGSAAPDLYDDARLERERGWMPALTALGVEKGDGPLVVVGPNAKEAGRLGSSATVATRGASAPLFAIAGAEPGTRVVALASATGALARVGTEGSVSVARNRRPGVPVSGRPSRGESPADIPFSLPAYDRAFDAKVRMLGGRCTCGTTDFPPRQYCSGCGRTDGITRVPLPRGGEVYTGVAIHVPVPGVAGPYAVVIAQLDDVPVRVLAHVTDTAAANPSIGARGTLVLRRVAVREGVPDYGYGWQPAVDDATAAELEGAR